MTTHKRKAAFGSFHSPIPSDVVVARATDLRHGLGQLCVDSSFLYWIEGRPQEGGRNVVCRKPADGPCEDASPAAASVRTRAHEYGGGDYTVGGGVLFFVDQADQRIYAHAPASARAATPLTPPGRQRFADLRFDAAGRRLICVRETHFENHEPANDLVAVDLGDGHIRVLAAGADFYASPALAPGSTHLAWLQWNHPNMPWDGCELWLAAVTRSGGLSEPRRIAGGTREWIFQPAWAPDGTLYFVSDRSGWANLYRWTGTDGEPVLTLAADFAAPPWNFGTTTYGFASATRAICAYTAEGIWRLGDVDVHSGTMRDITVDHTDIAQVRVAAGKVYFRGGHPSLPPCIVELDLTTETTTILRTPETAALPAADLSRPEPITFDSGGHRVHAFFYPPRNARFEGLPGERPPLIVVGHGGPTAAASTALDLKVQFWTSRGFAVVDVNYRGSTGFGRAYRESLNGQWGVADVEDCVAAARFLAARGDVDPQRLLIRGSSAGGFTCLSALTFHDAFRAGASYYGISDLEALVRDTHKFESHYTETLVGPYPECRDVYRARSPIHAVDQLARPLIIFQGLRDEVVPPSQAELLVAALRAKRLPVAYLTFSDEGHGFRDAKNSQRALEAELYFYGRILGFTPADAITPIVIENV